MGEWAGAAFALAIGLLWAGLSGCTTNPATGDSSFTGGFGKAEEINVGRREHPRVLRSFGGEYGTPGLRRYVASIGQLLAGTVERRDLKYTFTIVNSDIVNAFAMPGGYVYVSRGLLALASNEAELASVLAHELGHVNALHHGRRKGDNLLANILVTGLGIAVGRGAAQLGGLVAGGVLSSYSREHEYEADQLGIRYMTRAGYDPSASVEFLRKMRDEARFQAKRLGRSPDKVDEFNYLATHPAPSDRVARAARLATAARVADPMLAAGIYLDQIDGMLYGDDPAQGFIRGRLFAHPGLRFRFEVPPGFRLFNSPRAVIARGPNEALIRFDHAAKPADGPMRYYLTDIWGRRAGVSKVETLRINGLEAATGITRGRVNGKSRDLRLLAIRKNLQTIYRFVFISRPRDTVGLAPAFRRTSHSFRLMGKAEASALRPFKLRVVRAGTADSAAALAARMATGPDLALELFRALNGLRGGRDVRPGQRVKIVAR
ncbi:MAG: M48 family metalloprotease [Alphaproteobacteria bacterium]